MRTKAIKGPPPMAVKNQNALGYALIGPTILLILAVSIIPIIQTFLYSLQYYRLTDPMNQYYIGFDNYVTIFTSQKFIDSLTNTLIFAVSSVTLQLVIGLSGALIMNSIKRGVGLARTAILIPWAIPGVVVAQMFSFMFDGQLGIINAVMRQLGMLASTDSFAFLAKPGWAMFCVIITDTWKQFPFVALMLLAGLQIIPDELYEAARVDGAGTLKQFTSITLPMIRPMILVTLLFRTMGALRIFDIIFTMTGGGPADSTTTLLYDAYRYLFTDMNFGLGSAMSTIVFLIVFVASMIYINLFKTRGED